LTAGAKPFAAACERNREPILAVLRRVFADRRRVLEIGSGTGQHAAYFAAALPALTWQASDRRANLHGIGQWLAEAGLGNTPNALEFDVARHDAPVGSAPPYDALFSANTLHIMSWPEVQRLFTLLPALTTPDAILAIYGPFNYDGRHTSPSNAAFDDDLRRRSPAMGIRDARAVDELAAGAGFALVDDVAMPANNRCRVWRRCG
jgi:cyclopropane fatty-acyl-phospholipid synthase-like methyltransferase